MWIYYAFIVRASRANAIGREEKKLARNQFMSNSSFTCRSEVGNFLKFKWTHNANMLLVAGDLNSEKFEVVAKLFRLPNWLRTFQAVFVLSINTTCWWCDESCSLGCSRRNKPRMGRSFHWELKETFSINYRRLRINRDATIIREYFKIPARSGNFFNFLRNSPSTTTVLNRSEYLFCLILNEFIGTVVFSFRQAWFFFFPASLANWKPESDSSL